MPAVEPLIVKLIADNRAFVDSMNNSQRIADKRLGAIEARGVKMGQGIKSGFNLAKGAAIGFIASLGVDAVIRAVTTGLDYAASLGEVATQLGVTTDALQEYRYAGSQAGLATEETDQALSQLTRRIGEAASGTKAQAEAFDKLGVSVKGANGEIIDAGEAIPLIADALQKVESPAERAAILMDLFGRSGQKLEPLLSGGSKAVNQLRDAAHSLGIVLNSEQIAKADETADKLDALKQVLSAKIAGAVADNTGSILEFANALVTLVGNIGGAIREYKRLQAEFKIGLGNTAAFALQGVNPNLSAALRGTARQNRSKAESNRIRGGFADIDISKSNIGGRNNLVAQRDPIADFRAALTPAESAALILGPTVQQTTVIAKKLNEGQGELLGIYAEIASLAADLIDTTEARVAAEKEQIEIDKILAIDRINASDNLTKDQKEKARLGQEAIALAKSEIANRKLEVAERERQLDADRGAANLASILNDTKLAALQDEYDLAKSIADRARIAAQIVETETQSALDAVDRQLLEEDINDAKREELEAIRARIVADDERGKANAKNGNLSASAQYLKDIQDTNFGDEADKFGVEALKDLNAGLADAIVNSADLGDVLEDTGKRFLAQLIEMTLQLLVIKPLLESLSGSGGVGGGGFSGILGSISSIFRNIPAFANGTNYAPGGVSLVGERGPELVNLPRGAQVIPNSMLRANAAQPGNNGANGMVTLRVEMTSDLDARIQSKSADVAIEVVRTAAPSIRDAAVAETFRRGARPGFR